MTGAQMLDMIMARVARTGDTTLRALALIEMVQKQTELENGDFKPWFLMTDDTASYSTAANTEHVTLTIASFIGFEEEAGGVWYKDTTITNPDQWVRIERKPYADMKDEYFEEDATAKPVYWDYFGTKLYMRPIPDAVYPLRIMGYTHDTAPADGATSNLWTVHAPNWLAFETAAIIAGVYLQNDALSQQLIGHAGRARDLVWKETVSRRSSQQHYQMGDD